MNSPILDRANFLATTDKFSGSRLRRLRRLYDEAEGSDKEKIGQLFEVFVVLANTMEFEMDYSEIMGDLLDGDD